MLIVDKPMPTNCYDCALDCCWDEGTKPAEYAEKRKPSCPIKGELVRCGECKYHIAYRCQNDMMLWTHMCKLGHGTLGDDWFCADGERKEKEDGTN